MKDKYPLELTILVVLTRVAWSSREKSSIRKQEFLG